MNNIKKNCHHLKSYALLTDLNVFVGTRKKYRSGLLRIIRWMTPIKYTAKKEEKKIAARKCLGTIFAVIFKYIVLRIQFWMVWESIVWHCALHNMISTMIIIIIFVVVAVIIRDVIIVNACFWIERFPIIHFESLSVTGDIL